MLLLRNCGDDKKEGKSSEYSQWFSHVTSLEVGSD